MYVAFYGVLVLVIALYLALVAIINAGTVITIAAITIEDCSQNNLLAGNFFNEWHDSDDNSIFLSCYVYFYLTNTT